jgi:tripartite-type tricarboxylate transporter receptor subunit TctC
MKKSIIAVLAATLATAVAAQTRYPEKPIRMIVPFPPGSASDFLARTTGQKLNEKYGQQVVIDNRPGAGGVVGSTLLAKAVPDGYTLGVIGQPHLINAILQKDAPYRALDDVVAIAQIASLPNVLVVSPNLPVKTTADLIALAKSKPGELNFGSAGIGASSHIAGEAFKAAAGINVTHVPFKLLSDVFTEMMAGRVHLYLFPLPAAMPMLKDNKLHVLAVGTPKAVPALPGVPTIADSGLPGFQTQSWFGVVGPSKLSRAIVAQLNKDVVDILQQADTRERFLRQGADAVITTPEEFQKLMQSEYAKYQKLVKDAGISTQ